MTSHSSISSDKKAGRFLAGAIKSMRFVQPDDDKNCSAENSDSSGGGTESSNTPESRNSMK